MNNIEKYIKENTQSCVRENRFDDGTLLGIPYPYIVPSAEAFHELYYWDTYFTNLWLLKDIPVLAKHNIDNMLYLVNKYGFMPNGTRTFYLNRSQPPFLSEAVKDVYEHYRDTVWLCGAYLTLEKEYEFWMENRCSFIGLNCYAPNVSQEDVDKFAEEFNQRVGDVLDAPKEQIAAHYLSSCESGWDINPRWDFEGQNFAQVDLNSLLFGMENNMAYFSELLGRFNDTAKWKYRAGKRLELMNKYMLTDDNLFLDYNFKNGRKSSVFSVASFFPLYAKVATVEQAEAAVKNLPRLEAEYGIVTCEKENRDIAYQWDYPNGWACLQYIVISGLAHYGYLTESLRIAEKFVNLVEAVFEQTGHLWEKYNVVEGNINVNNEYKMPTMLGWSAGVYLSIKDFIKTAHKK